MNLEQIRNPHLIYPGQVLVLTRVGDRAWLQLAADEPPTVKLSPRVRTEPLDEAIPALPLKFIEPFLTDVTVVDPDAHAQAPRIVAGPEQRVLLARGDRAYVRGQIGSGTALSGKPLQMPANQPWLLDVYRQAQPLKDPQTGELVGYEAQRVGQALLIRGEQQDPSADKAAAVIPATVDIVQARQEIRVGDRLLPPHTQELGAGFIPHAPVQPVTGHILKVHGDAVQIAGQYQVVVLNRGREHGLENGHVLALLKESARVTDTTDPTRPALQLPAEPNGVMMVFRTFERVAYALVLQITDAVKVGDRFTNP